MDFKNGLWFVFTSFFIVALLAVFAIPGAEKIAVDKHVVAGVTYNCPVKSTFNEQNLTCTQVYNAIKVND